MDNHDLEIQALKDICSSLTKQLERCEKQNQFLRQMIDKKEDYDQAIQRALEQHLETNRRQQRRNDELEIRVKEWQRIAERMAHTF